MWVDEIARDNIVAVVQIFQQTSTMNFAVLYTYVEVLLPRDDLTRAQEHHSYRGHVLTDKHIPRGKLESRARRVISNEAVAS